MKKLMKFSTNTLTMFFVWLFAVIAPWLFYCCRIGHVYVDIVLFHGFCQTLLWIMMLSAVAVSVLAFLRLRVAPYNDDETMPLPFKAACVAFFALTAVFTLVWVISLGVMGVESTPVAGKMLLETLPFGTAVVVAGGLFLFLPALKNRKVRAAVAACVITVGFFAVIGSLYPLSTYEFVSAPMVIDTGEGYSVVFATTDTGTGYLEYSHDGKDYKIYDTEDGRKVNSRIHSFFVPYEHLDNNTYRVGATRVIDELSYGGTNGKTIVSGDYAFKRNSGEVQRILCVSDWHTRIEKAEKVIAMGGSYDAVILLGDAAAGLQFEEEAADYIVRFGGDVSGGVIPVIYTRGNHETRGAYATELSDALGLDSFYHEVVCGDYRFIVLDSVEDKPDDHPEYGGMADYSAYRAGMIEWLEGLSPDPSKHTMIVCHDREICIEEDLRERAFAAFEELDATVMLSGHSHDCELILTESLPIYTDGGFKNGKYIASEITLSPTGISVYGWGADGEVQSGSFEWRTL